MRAKSLQRGRDAYVADSRGSEPGVVADAASFNGAATRTSRIGQQTLQPGFAESRFNGAATRTSRIADIFDASACCKGMLQRGRDAYVADSNMELVAVTHGWALQRGRDAYVADSSR